MKAILLGSWAYFLLAALLLAALAFGYAGVFSFPAAGITSLVISAAVATWLGLWGSRIYSRRSKMTIHYLVACMLSVTFVGVALYDGYIGVALFIAPFLFVAYGWDAARNTNGALPK